MFTVYVLSANLPYTVPPLIYVLYNPALSYIIFCIPTLYQLTLNSTSNLQYSSCITLSYLIHILYYCTFLKNCYPSLSQFSLFQPTVCPSSIGTTCVISSKGSKQYCTIGLRGYILGLSTFITAVFSFLCLTYVLYQKTS